MAERETYFRHSLKVNLDRCQGCTTCMRSCPTGAIRIRGGKAVVGDNKCVDCGQCMKVCPHKAIFIQQDVLRDFFLRAGQDRAEQGKQQQGDQQEQKAPVPDLIHLTVSPSISMPEIVISRGI